MATVVRRPRIVSTEAGVTQVGGTNALADDDDATYLRFPNTLPAPAARLEFDPVAVPTGANYVATFSGRGFIDAVGSMQTQIVSDGGISFLTGSSTVVGGPDSLSDVVFEATPEDFFYDELIGGLAGSFTALIESASFATVTELTLTVVFGGGLTPPCHLYPRDDDQGVGTGAIWPPPSSGRPGSYY